MNNEKLILILLVILTIILIGFKLDKKGRQKDIQEIMLPEESQILPPALDQVS